MRMNLAGISVGHHTDLAGATGCTVILAPGGATASVEVRGGAPGTRETDLLSPHSTVDEVHAILLTGGSAFGLAAATGVVRFLEERGYGYDTPYARVPLVPAAVIYDLGIGSATARVGEEGGYLAAMQAGEEVEEGSVGVGTGATVGKVRGEEGWMKGGFGVHRVGMEYRSRNLAPPESALPPSPPPSQRLSLPLTGWRAPRLPSSEGKGDPSPWCPGRHPLPPPRRLHRREQEYRCTRWLRPNQCGDRLI